MSAAESHAEPDHAPSLVDLLLVEQGQLRAVDEFTAWHAQLGHARDASAERFETLIPATAPAAGQQYAFSVDLDLCTGCKACVTACHGLNGLEKGETWRKVGEIERRAANAPDGPLRQTVTTACHHCLDPACLAGCPVRAYEKDPATGIVVHLDDQCIGCRYCQLMCPYDVPQYSERLGVVRKCDLCRDRLATGEAPACVQGCPNEAITITLVCAEASSAEQEAHAMLLPMVAGGMSRSEWTRPTTQYRSERLPGFEDPIAARVAREGDWSAVEGAGLTEAPAHTPLAVMLVMTQSAVGVLVFDRLLAAAAPAGAYGTGLHALALVVCAVLGGVGLGASFLHLGRPQWAFRAVLGLRTSWMSREIVCFGGFAAALAVALTATGATSLSALSTPLAQWGVPTSLLARVDAIARFAAIVAGLGGLVCSVMLYAVTNRPLWRRDRTARRFLATAFVGGAGATAVLWATRSPWVVFGSAFASALSTLVKLRWERGRLVQGVDGFDEAALARTRSLLAGALASTELRRRRLGLGSVVLQLVVAGVSGAIATRMQMPSNALATDSTLQSIATFVLPTLAGVAWAAAVAGELVERGLFFRGEAMRGMPGVR